MGAQNAVRILSQALDVGPRCGPVILIAIDGRSGAGKSTLADDVAGRAESQGFTAAIVNVDDLCPGWDGLPEVPDRLAALIRQLEMRGQGSYPSWDWIAGGPGPIRHVGPSDMVIIEGAAAMDRRWAEQTSVAVWMDGPASIRKSRALDRDGDTFAPHWDRWAAAEDAYFQTGSQIPDISIEIDDEGPKSNN